MAGATTKLFPHPLTIVIGPRGSGKSKIAEWLAQDTDMPVLWCAHYPKPDGLPHRVAFLQEEHFLGFQTAFHRFVEQAYAKQKPFLVIVDDMDYMSPLNQFRQEMMRRLYSLENEATEGDRKGKVVVLMSKDPDLVSFSKMEIQKFKFGLNEKPLKPLVGDGGS